MLQIIQPVIKDMDTLLIRRFLPNAPIRNIGPWVFFDHAGPKKFAAGEGLDIRPHPHIHLATVTYLFSGQILHRDSLGVQQVIYPGDLNLMVAGHGIVHSERTPYALRKEEHTLETLQLWHALPKEQEERAPAFYHYSSKETPTGYEEGVTIKLLIGRAFGLHAPTKTFCQTLYAHIDFLEGAQWILPAQSAQEIALYIHSGSLTIENKKKKQQVHYKTGTLCILESMYVHHLTALEKTKVIFIGGESLGRRYIWWNFIARSEKRIQKAQEDWEKGAFPKIPSDSSDYISLPKK